MSNSYTPRSTPSHMLRFYKVHKHLLEFPRARVAASKWLLKNYSKIRWKRRARKTPRAKRHLRRIAGLTRLVAGATRRTHAPEPAPRRALSTGRKRMP